MACWLKILQIYTQEWYSCIIFLVFEEPHIGLNSCQVNSHFYKQCITIPSPRTLSTMSIAVWLAVIILTRVRWAAMQFQSAFPWWIRIWCLFSILLFISLLSVNAVLGMSISWFSSFSVSILALPAYLLGLTLPSGSVFISYEPGQIRQSSWNQNTSKWKKKAWILLRKFRGALVNHILKCTLILT